MVIFFQVFVQQISDLQNYLDLSEDYLLEIGTTILRPYYELYLAEKQHLRVDELATLWLKWKEVIN